MRTPSLFEIAPRFDGPTFDPVFDGDRLRRQLGRVFDLMRDGGWRSLPEIAAATGDGEASISARLRDLRKPKFGGYDVQRRRRVGCGGTWEYRIAASSVDSSRDVI